MNKTWKVFERTVSGLQILLGITIMILVLCNLKFILEHLDYSWSDISIYKITKNNHHVFAKGFLGVISGILLFRNKLIGWILSIAFWLINGIGIILTFILKNNEDNKIINSSIEYIILGLMVVTFLSLAISFTAKQFRIKYAPNKKSWITIALIFLIFVIDGLIFD